MLASRHTGNKSELELISKSSVLHCPDTFTYETKALVQVKTKSISHLSYRSMQLHNFLSINVPTQEQCSATPRADTHIYCISFKYAELQKQLKLDLAFLKKLLHLRLGLIQLLQDCLYVVD